MTLSHHYWPLVCPLLICACFTPYATPLPEEGSSSSSDSESESSDSTTTSPDDESSSGAPPEDPWCGDGIVDPSEQCDDGVNDGSYGGCQSDCMSRAPYCGDGITQDGNEACDDGDALNGDGCNVDCVLSGTLLWSKHEDVSGPNDVGRTIATGPDSSVIIAGDSYPDSAWLTKYDPNGNELWFETIPTNTALTGAQVIVSQGTTFIGALQNNLSGHRHPAVFAYSDDAELLWEASYPGEVQHMATTDLEDGILIAAGDAGTPTWLRAYSATGQVVWTNTLPVNLHHPRIESHPNGGFVVAGNLLGSFWLRRYDANQQELWTRTIDVSGIPGGIAVLDDHSIAVSIYGIGGASSLLVSLDPDGQQQWVREGPEYEPGGWAYISSLASSPDGDFFSCGSIGNAQAVTEALIVRYSASGESMWEQRLSTPFDIDGVARAYDVSADAEGNVVATGAVSTDASEILWVAKFAP